VNDIRKALELGRDAAEDVLNQVIAQYTDIHGTTKDFRGRIKAARESLNQIEAALARPLAAQPRAAPPDIRKALPGTFAGCVGGLRLRLVTEDELLAALARPQEDDEAELERATIRAMMDPQADIPEGCEVDDFSSRVCQRGTKSCVVDHVSTTPTEPATQSGQASRKAR
jgi:hypothetical protein